MIKKPVEKLPGVVGCRVYFLDRTNIEKVFVSKTRKNPFFWLK